MVEEKWVLKYKTTRFHLLLNYFVGVALVIVLLSWLPFSKLTSLFDRLFFFGLLATITFLFVEPEVKIWRNEYVLSPEAVIYRDSLLKKSIEIPYSEIENLRVEQNLLQKFLDCGNVLIESDKEKIKMVGISNPNEAFKVIEYKIGEIKLGKEKEEKELQEQKPEEKKGI
jgi:hypothetical protein